VSALSSGGSFSTPVFPEFHADHPGRPDAQKPSVNDAKISAEVANTSPFAFERRQIFPPFFA
jgi:hypothetical protein